MSRTIGILKLVALGAVMASQIALIISFRHDHQFRREVEADRLRYSQPEPYTNCPQMAAGFPENLLFFPKDADHTPRRKDLAYGLYITSSPYLTHPRKLILPSETGITFRVENETLGGQSISIGAKSGAPVVIPNGYMEEIMFDGEKYSVLFSGKACK